MTQSFPHTPARIAFIEASWHAEIVDQARLGFLAEVEKLGHAPSIVETFTAPGSFEIPLQVQILAKTGRYDAIVAAGLVVDGGIYRHDFVAETVVGALMRVQLDTGTPVFSVVLTPHHFHEHETHDSFFKAHFLTKGAEAARTCFAALETLKRLKAMTPAANDGLARVG